MSGSSASRMALDDPDAEVSFEERDRQRAPLACAVDEHAPSPETPPPPHASALSEWDPDAEVAFEERDWQSTAAARAAAAARAWTLARVLTAALDRGWPIGDFALLASACATTREAGLLHARGLLTSAGGRGNRLHWAVAKCGEGGAASGGRPRLPWAVATCGEGGAASGGARLQALLASAHPVAVQTALRQHARGLPPPAMQAVQQLSIVAISTLAAFRFPATAVGVDAPAVTPAELAGVSDGESAAAAVHALLLAQLSADGYRKPRLSAPELAEGVRALLAAAALESGTEAAASPASCFLPWPLRGEQEIDVEGERLPRECVGGATLLHVAVATPGIDVEALEALLSAPGGAAALEVEAPPCGTPLAQCLASDPAGERECDAAVAAGLPAALVRAGARMAARSVGAAPGVLLASLWRRRAQELPEPDVLLAMLDAGFLDAGSDDAGNSVPERAASAAVLSCFVTGDRQRAGVLARCSAAAGGAAALAAALRAGLARTPYLATGLELGAAAGCTGWLRQLQLLAGGDLLTRAVVLHDFGDAEQRGRRSLIAAASRGSHSRTLAFLLECAAAAAEAGRSRLLDDAGGAAWSLPAGLGVAIDAAMGAGLDSYYCRGAAHCIAMLLAAGADPAQLRAGRLSVIAAWDCEEDERDVGALRTLAAAILSRHAAALPALEPSRRVRSGVVDSSGRPLELLDATQPHGMPAWAAAEPAERSVREEHLLLLVAELATAALVLCDLEALRAVSAHLAGLPCAMTGASLLAPETVVLAVLSSKAPLAALDAACVHRLLLAEAPPDAMPLDCVVLRAVAGAIAEDARMSRYSELLFCGQVPTIADKPAAIAVLRALRSRGYSFHAGGGSPLHGEAIVGRAADPALLLCLADLGVLASPALVNVPDPEGLSPLARCRRALASAPKHCKEALQAVDAILTAAGGLVLPERAAGARDAPVQMPLPRASAAAPFPTTEEAFHASFQPGQVIVARTTAAEYRDALALQEAQEASWRLPPQGLF